MRKLSYVQYQLRLLKAVNFLRNMRSFSVNIIQSKCLQQFLKYIFNYSSLLNPYRFFNLMVLINLL